MFFGRMIEYAISKPAKVDDGLGYKQKTYKDAGKAKIYITHLSTSDYTANDFDLRQKQYVGHTQNQEIDAGWLIDGKYEVQSAEPAKNSRTLYLSRLEGKANG